MKLLLRGHDDRYAVEQLQLALFPEEPMEPVTEPFSGDGAVSSLHTGAVWPPPARGGGRCAHPPPSAAKYLL